MNHIKILFIFVFSSILFSNEIGIYQKLHNASSSFEETTTMFEANLKNCNFQLHATYDFNSSNTDGQKSRLYILTSPEYIEMAKDEKPNTISAQVIRVAIYEYGEGRKTYINMTNPIAHAMVYYEKSNNYNKLLTGAREVVNSIKNLVSNIPGELTLKQQPPLRSENDYNGYNGDGPAKMMALWKDWEDSQDVLFKAKTYDEAIEKIETTLNHSIDAGIESCVGWNILTKIEINGAFYFGITNHYTENRTTKINSDFRKNGKTIDAPLPGIDHTSAHPMEIIVYQDGKNIKAIQYGQMWRMQLYYWDSGYAAFAKYTMIPGIISGSIEDLFND